MSRRTETAVGRARQIIEEQRTKLAQVEAEKTAAEVELESMQARVGAEVLDNPDSADQAAKAMQALRDRIFIAGKALEAQLPRVHEAESAYLLAEAEVLNRVADAARRELEQHESRTAELLRLLAAHEGPFVPERVLLEERHVAGTPFERPNDTSEILQDRVTEAERPVRILRQLAAREDPGVPLEQYPACVASEGAVVKAPGYLRSRQRQDLERRELEKATIPALEGRVAELEQERKRAEAEGRLQELEPSRRFEPTTITTRLNIAREKLEKAREELGARTGITS